MRLEKALKAKALLDECGVYDSGIAGAIGEIYAEEELGMKKAPRGEKGFDGWINERKVSVKTKERRKPRTDSQEYAAISEKNFGLADDLLVVLLSGSEKPISLGPVPIATIKYTKTKKEPFQRRYTLRSIKEALRVSDDDHGPAGN